MTSAGAVPDIAEWNEPEGIAPRGTLIVLPGRGEHPGVYERFGRRIAADGYRVRAVSDPTLDEARTSEQVRALLTAAGPEPGVLAGSDAGAPVLGVHGADDADDAVSPLAAASAWYRRVPSAELVSIAGGRHDALNDQTHRTAAATVVLFLERLRVGADAPALARAEDLR